jgi:hypothetical protein
LLPTIAEDKRRPESVSSINAALDLVRNPSASSELTLLLDSLLFVLSLSAEFVS